MDHTAPPGNSTPEPPDLDSAIPGDVKPPPRVTPAARLVIGLVRIYQAIGRPFFGGHCRFHPTCSDYAVEALQTHGAFRGSWLMIRRVLRCHPLGGAGYDPVPPRRDA